MKHCINCKHCKTHDIIYICGLGRFEIRHPRLVGGSKCKCYEKQSYNKEQIIYPQKEQQ